MQCNPSHLTHMALTIVAQHVAYNPIKHLTRASHNPKPHPQVANTISQSNMWSTLLMHITTTHIHQLRNLNISGQHTSIKLRVPITHTRDLSNHILSPYLIPTSGHYMLCVLVKFHTFMGLSYSNFLTGSLVIVNGIYLFFETS